MARLFGYKRAHSAARKAGNTVQDSIEVIATLPCTALNAMLHSHVGKPDDHIAFAANHMESLGCGAWESSDTATNRHSNTIQSKGTQRK